MPAAAITRSAAAAAARRPFSLYTQVRQMGRSFEYAPYERLSVTMKPAKPDYAKNMSWLANKTFTFFPIAGAVISLPTVCIWALDGQMGRL